ncbi:MAG: sugar phosphate nucleotidyltransferase [Negativicutes bacterium]|nr:sugar phosphate nucleotidyltransferase [Negativicutes bacterium]
MVEEVAILCGGRGRRLRAVVSDRPKPLVTIDGRPFLDILIDYFSRFGARRFILLAGYRGEDIEGYANEKRQSADNISVEVSTETEELGTAGALRRLGGMLSGGVFIVANGDSYCRLAVDRLVSHHLAGGQLVTLAASWQDDCGDFGRLELDGRDNILAFREKTGRRQGGMISAGVYCMSRQVLGLIPTGRCSLERDVFPALTARPGMIRAYRCGQPVMDIGTPGRLANFCKWWQNNGD